MRPEQTDPEMNTTTPRSDRENRETLERTTTEGATSWQDIKSRFVDDPAGALAAADELVRRTVDQQIRALRDEVEALRAHDGDDESSTEGMRTRLIRYEEFCDRLSHTMH